VRALFLCDLTGHMAEPWLAAGYECWCVDLQHPPHPQYTGGLIRIGADVRRWQPDNGAWDFVAAFPPCTNLAVSGARWFRSKGLRGLIDALEVVEACRVICEGAGAPWMLENPVSTLSTYWRKPDYSFHPWQYAGLEPADHYTKKTCLWTGGGFVMPAPCPLDTAGPPDDRIHKAAPGPGRANFRSATPRGFARAVFAANHRDAERAA
jgi:hypothetical protein